MCVRSLLETVSTQADSSRKYTEGVCVCVERGEHVCLNVHTWSTLISLYVKNILNIFCSLPA